jgi:signal peptide peptidase SppA
MKSYPHLFAKLFCQPLMLHGPTRASFESVLMDRMSAPARPRSEDVEHNPDSGRKSRIYEQIGNVAVITIDGVIDKRVSEMDLECYGGVDLAKVDEALALALHSTADIIVLDIASPGGSVVGVHETYSRILAACEAKEVHAFVNTQACSAGYYLASACDHIAAASSAIVGSVGVYMALIDQSRRLDAQGLTVNVMQGGKWKTVGADYKPLADDERAMLQAKVDSLYSQFKASVNARRPQVEDSTMQGQWFDASEGFTLGLVDELTGETLDEYVTRLLMQ